MRSDKEGKTIYYKQLKIDDWSMYLAATDQGLCFVGSQNGDLTEVEEWLEKKRPEAKLVENWGKLAIYAEQLAEYLNGKRQLFDFPIDVIGTEFQEAVWEELRNIPFGQKRTYTDIAENIGKPGAVRAVGSAIGKNPVMMAIPCHRVINKDGKMGGFRGGIPMKERLLELENSK
ncbi:methylated-DNA--[protein]-cysteine S-methyltransferase [Virgibacillus ainsalahensis]